MARDEKGHFLPGTGEGAPFKTHCVNGHDLSVYGITINRSDRGKLEIGRTCRLCRDARSAKWRSKANPEARRKYHRDYYKRKYAKAGTLLGTAPNAWRSNQARKAWETMRARYGPTGMSPRMKASCETRRRRQKQTHCKRGHLLNDRNVHIYSSKNKNGKFYLQRHCLLCRKEKRLGRPAWIVVNGCKVSVEIHDTYFLKRRAELYAIMIASHPDKGGTSRKFRIAKTVLDTFIASETVWYTQHGLKIPDHRKRPVNTVKEVAC